MHRFSINCKVDSVIKAELVSNGLETDTGIMPPEETRAEMLSNGKIRLGKRSLIVLGEGI